MGEVYRASDTRLNRTVAIKVVKQQFSERFEREARSVAALNHPHVCSLFDVGEHQGAGYLVMELVDGKPLGGPLPVETVVRYGIQICQALAAAHRQGIVHRDLKPANILVTKNGVKLLDFGLAKQQSRAQAVNEGSTTLAITGEHTVVGTPSYMSPEQVEGKEADARADIFAFGCILYEMVTGRRAFMGKSVSSVMAAVLATEPQPLSELVPVTPPALAAIVARCLAKDPDERWQSAADVAAALELVAAGRPQPVPRRRRFVLPIAAVVAALAAGLGVAAFIPAREAPPQPAVRMQVRIRGEIVGKPVLSPDGVTVAFAMMEEGTQARRIWIRRLDSLTMHPLPGTDRATLLTWSPDSREIAYHVAGGGLYRVGLNGAAPQSISPGDFFPDVWMDDGRILVSSREGPIQAAPAGGGTSKPLSRLNAANEDYRHGLARLLPGNRFVYAAVGKERQVRVASLSTGEDLAVLSIPDIPAYDPSGYLIYADPPLLVARRFDPQSLRMDDKTATLAEGLVAGGLGGAPFSISRNGSIALRMTQTSGLTQIGIYDRAGRRESTIGEPADYTNPALSPDGKRLAVDIGSPGVNRDIWIFDLDRGSRTRFTSHPMDDFNPVWSPDGSRIAFASNRKGTRDLWVKTVDTADEEQLLFEAPGDQAPEQWSPDGRWLVFNDPSSGRTMLKALPMGPSAPAEKGPVAITEGRHHDHHSSISPDGRFIAYDSNRQEVFVRTFPPTAARWQVSVNGGQEPHWSPNGRELYYFRGNTLWAVSVNASKDRIQAGTPRELFKIGLPLLLRNRMVVARDGRFFINALPEATELNEPSPITLILNWRSLLKK
jgi:eukaryotic-like serine/threonine-protein kinase